MIRLRLSLKKGSNEKREVIKKASGKIDERLKSLAIICRLYLRGGKVNVRTNVATLCCQLKGTMHKFFNILLVWWEKLE